MILRSPTDYENGGFPFVARMEQSVIRVSSFTHADASATPHATFLDSASLHPGYNSKAHPHAPCFQRRAQRSHRKRIIRNRNLTAKSAKAAGDSLPSFVRFGKKVACPLFESKVFYSFSSPPIENRQAAPQTKIKNLS